jgi:hypothetical protein
MGNLLRNLADLLKVKTIITLIIICGVTYGFVTGIVNPETFCTLAGAVVTYYFTKN